MNRNAELFFVAENKDEVEVANKYFEGQLELSTYDYDFIVRIDDGIEEFAIAKVVEAYKMTRTPVIASCIGIYVDVLNGYPGVHVRHFQETLGIRGLLKLLENEENRECIIRQCLAYYDGNNQPKVFCGEYKGNVVREFEGDLEACNGLGYMFVPERKDKVWAELSEDEKNEYLKENQSRSACMRFKEWYIDYLASEEYYKSKRLAENWEKTCNYISENKMIPNIPFITWIKPMKLIDSNEESLMFELIDEMLDEIMRDIVRHIRRRYERVILDAYNRCTGSKCLAIEIKYY
ncbi:MAG: hypothetical protein IKL22_11610 [Lachnospiraceae bacterium]|nr:hypothetical protein [Lachnospiraceae bacterium]